MSSYVLSIVDPFKKWWADLAASWTEDYAVHTIGFQRGYMAGFSDLAEVQITFNPQTAVTYIQAYAKGYGVGVEDRKKGKKNIYTGERHEDEF